MKNKKGVVTVGILLALIAAILTLTNVAALLKAQTAADPKGNSSAPAAASVVPAVAAVNHILKGTYINTCTPYTSCPAITLPAATEVALDAPTTITCSAAVGKTCTITDDAWLQLINNTSDGNNAASVTLVLDGVPSATYFSGSTGTPSGTWYDGLASKTDIAINVAHGTHTVYTEARSEYGGKGGAWVATYRVYVP
jgi:hypothetical protein